MQTVDPPGDHLTIATSMYREMDRRFWLEQAEADRNTEEAGMELDPRTDRLPFHDPDEAEQARADATAPSHDARIRHLQRVPLFSGFNEDELRRVAELSRIVEAPAGTVVTQIGEPGDSFFIIIDGAVGVRTPVGAGSELHPGDFFGEMSLLGGEPRSATIVATTDLRLLIVDRSHFWRLNEHGQTTLGKLRQGTKLSDQLLLMGVGWLAREGKVSIVQHGRTVKVSLREG